MNEWLEEQKKKYELLLSVYGKIISVVILFFICVGLVLMVARLITPQKLRVSFLDVGQGDAILIQTPSGKNMLIDGGPGNAVMTQLARELSFFSGNIEVIEETHPDADHVTGLIPVLEKYIVGMVLVSSVEGHTGIFDDLTRHIENEHADVHVAHTGDVVDFHDGVVVNVLYPPVKYVAKKNDTNDASVSVVITYGTESFLLTGDLPSTEESKLISSGLMKNITVYKAGHHGSKYSSGEQLLTYIRPEYSVISAGKDNKYGHPNPEAMERLQKYSQEILSTIERGTITFVTDGQMIDVVTSK